MVAQPCSIIAAQRPPRGRCPRDTFWSSLRRNRCPDCAWRPQGGEEMLPCELRRDLGVIIGLRYDHEDEGEADDHEGLPGLENPRRESS